MYHHMLKNELVRLLTEHCRQCSVRVQKMIEYRNSDQIARIALLFRYISIYYKSSYVKKMNGFEFGQKTVGNLLSELQKQKKRLDIAILMTSLESRYFVDAFLCITTHHT